MEHWFTLIHFAGDVLTLVAALAGIASVIANRTDGKGSGDDNSL